MKTLLLEPTGGLAGDMLLAALLDLGDERFGLGELEALARALVPGECELELERTRRGSIAAARLLVRTPESAHPPRRGLSDLVALLADAPLGERARARAASVLRRLAEAEARVHQQPVEQVHFHEVGAVDTLIDVAGAVLALERLEVQQVFSSAPLLGEGSVSCAHGELPVPAPAVAELLLGLPVQHGGGPGERTTPTGAALYAELADVHAAPGEFTAQAVGYGAGSRDPETGPPNLTRVQLGRVGAGPARVEAWLGSCNLDDSTPEELGFALAGLRAAGALEAWSSPAQMKKDRPGVVLHFLCRADEREPLERAVFTRTPSLGVRWTRLERAECERRTIVLEHRGQQVRVVVRTPPPGVPASPALDRSPEFDDLARLAEATGLSLRQLEGELQARLEAGEGG